MFGTRTTIFVKEHVAVFKLADTYDLLDTETQAPLGQAIDEPAPWAKWLRLAVDKRYLPTTVNVYAQGSGQPLVSIHKKPALFRTRLVVSDGQGRPLVFMRSKLISLGGAFMLEDAQGRQIGELKGDWKGWDYAATLEGRTVGRVTKKWAGILKEAFTNADQYLVQAERAQDLPLMLGMAMAVDRVFKEQQG